MDTNQVPEKLPEISILQFVLFAVLETDHAVKEDVLINFVQTPHHTGKKGNT